MPRIRMDLTCAACRTTHAIMACLGGMLIPIVFSRHNCIARTWPFKRRTPVSAAPFDCGSYGTDPSDEACSSFGVWMRISTSVSLMSVTIDGSLSLRTITRTWPSHPMSLAMASAAYLSSDGPF